MLETQKLFKGLGWEEACKVLSTQYHIIAKEYDNFIKLNYNQIFSPEDNEYVMECRALLLDKSGEVISRGYPRFFNYGQRPEITGKFVFEGSTVYEKADGSMIQVYYNPYDDKWEIATRGTAFAESGQDYYPSFRLAVLSDGFGVTEDEFQAFCRNNLSPDWSTVFEYTSLKNRIVTPYYTSQMVLIAAFRNTTGEEYACHDDDLDTWGKLSSSIRVIRRFEFMSEHVMHEAVTNLEGLQEGFVCQDVNGLRIKIKNALYLKVHRLRGESALNPTKIASIVAENEQGEFLTYFPEYVDMFKPYETALHNLIRTIDNVWVNVHGLESQKDFALAIVNCPFKSLLFSMRKTEKSFDEIWGDAREDYRAKLLLDYMGGV